MLEYKGTYKIIIISKENVGISELLDSQTNNIFSASATKSEKMELYFVIKKKVSPIDNREKIISSIYNIFEQIKLRYCNDFIKIQLIPYLDFGSKFGFTILLDHKLPPLKFLFIDEGDEFVCRTIFSAKGAQDSVKSHSTAINLIEEFQKAQFFIDVSDYTGYYESRNPYYILHKKSQEIYILGVNWYTKTISLKQHDYCLQIWNLLIEERLKFQFVHYIRGSNGAILMFSYKDRDSLTSVIEWIQMIQNICGKKIPIILLGILIEQSPKLIAKWEIEDLMKKNKDLIYREILRFKANDLDAIFTELLQTILKLHNRISK